MNSRNRGTTIVLKVLAGILLCFFSPVSVRLAHPQVVINEVIADNTGVSPGDVTGGTPDMIELFNLSEENVNLGTDDPKTSYFLTDSPEFDAASAWQFPPSSNIVRSKSLVIFCDGKLPTDTESRCELHTNFQIDSDGREPLTLFGPEDENGERPIVDQVWLPPLRPNVSFGRFESGAGPAPVPLAEVLDTFVFNLLGSESPPTFGETCVEIGRCTGDLLKRNCLGGSNNPGTNLEPLLDRTSHSTNAPAAEEPVTLTVEVRDDKTPVSPNIASVEIVYQTQRLGETPVDHDPVLMSTDGVIHDRSVASGETSNPRPLDIWTEWTGEIPGQPEGVLVEFFFRVTDQEGLSTTRPRTLCEDGVGPCDREFGGPSCEPDEDDRRCSEPEFVGERFIECSTPYLYASGYTPRGNLGSVVVNEVVPRQDGILADITETNRCTIEDGCPQGDTFCCIKREDFIEIFNAGDEQADLSGLWLSDSYFRPRVWQFPENSIIAPKQYIIVWLDNDGDKCPDPTRAENEEVPCFWECPDPTDPAPEVLEFHTNFALNANGDQIFLRDTVDNNYGIVHGYAYEVDLDDEIPENDNIVFALVPNGDPTGCFVRIDKSSASPRSENPALNGVESCQPTTEEIVFLRGDCDGDGKAEGTVTDAVFLLQYNFLGGTKPPCLAACDGDADGKVEGIPVDAVYLLRFNFLGGPPPKAPFPNCGPSDLPSDRDPNLVGCETPPDPCP